MNRQLKAGLAIPPPLGWIELPRRGCVELGRTRQPGVRDLQVHSIRCFSSLDSKGGALCTGGCNSMIPVRRLLLTCKGCNEGWVWVVPGLHIAMDTPECRNIWDPDRFWTHWGSNTLGNSGFLGRCKSWSVKIKECFTYPYPSWGFWFIIFFTLAMLIQVQACVTSLQWHPELKHFPFLHEVLVENPWDKELTGKFLSELPKPLHTYANYFEWKSPLPFIKLKAELSLGKSSFILIIAKHSLKFFLGKFLRSMWEFSFLVCVSPDDLSLRLGISPGVGFFVFCSTSLWDWGIFSL